MFFYIWIELWTRVFTCQVSSIFKIMRFNCILKSAPRLLILGGAGGGEILVKKNNNNNNNKIGFSRK